MSRGERKAMITRDAPELSLSRQCRLLSIGRSSFYYAPRGESPSSLALMRRIDELFMKYPFYGSRQMVRQLRRDGVCVGRHRVRRLMRLIGLEAIYQAPRTSVPHPMHRIYPYLLKGMAIDQPNRVWCADITYIPVQRGFLYLVAIMDWATRHVLSWRLSNTMDAGFCAEALGDALARYGQPEIFNTDQGSQFTSLDFTGVLKNASIRISMDGRGRCMDNIFIERLWRSLKYEAVYLHELTDGFHAERVIGEWIGFYNTERPHSSLDGQTPAEAYGAGQPVDMMDKARAFARQKVRPSSVSIRTISEHLATRLSDGIRDVRRVSGLATPRALPARQAVACPCRRSDRLEGAVRLRAAGARCRHRGVPAESHGGSGKARCCGPRWLAGAGGQVSTSCS